MNVVTRRRPKILIVEDVESNIELLTGILLRENYQVAIAKTGRTALVKAKAHKFDLILLDVILPDIDGFVVAQHLKDDNRSEVPILFTTVKSDPNSVLRGFEAGGVDYITKPYNEMELLARVKTHLDLKFANEELIRAKEEAINSNKLKTAFISNMSHEIRTPMNAIIGFSDLLLQPDFDEKQKEDFVNIIRSNGNVLLKLIDNILEISCIERGENNINKCKCLVNEILYGLLMTFDNELKKLDKHEVTLHLKAANADPKFSLYTDPVKLGQILSNLIGNAMKFTSKGVIEFGFVFENDAEFDIGKWIKFYVKDSGIGIPEDKQDIIFDSFRQVDSSITRVYGGTGLGLAISKSLVEMLGGEIWLESKIGVGSTFWFKLPVERNDYPEMTVSPSDKVKDVYQWNGKTILVVDDMEATHILIERMLKKSKAKVIYSNNGNDALRYFDEAGINIDLVLLDLHMPGMSGYDVVKQIRMKNVEIPVIAQTALVINECYDKAISEGFDDVILKPFKADELLTTIDCFLNKK